MKYFSKAFIFILFVIILFAVACQKRDFVKVAMIKTTYVQIKNDTAVLGHGIIIDIGSGNINQYGFCISSTPNPTISNQKTEYGIPTETGDFSGYMNITRFDSLNFIRAYMSDSTTAVYGSDIQFIAPKQILLPYRKWKLTASIVSPAYNGITDNYATYPEYTKDDYLYFFPNGTWTSNEGQTKQNASDPDINAQGKWSIDLLNSKLTISIISQTATNTLTIDIISLDKDKLILRSTSVNNGITYVWTDTYTKMYDY